MGAGTNEGRRSGAGVPRDALTGAGADVSSPAGVARVLRDQYDLGLSDLERFEGGWDAAATMWTGVDAGGARYALKITSRDVQFGLSLAGSAGLAAAGGVLQPVPTRDGALWATAAGHLITVSHWVDGADAVDLGPDHVDWHELGRVLRAVHDQPVPEGVRPQRGGIRRSSSSPRALIDTVDRAYRHGVAPDLTRRWDAARPRLRHLAAVARQLKRTRRPTTRVTAHGDPHLGNVLLDDSGRPWLIDFDEATIAPREVDLMLVELGVMFDAPDPDAGHHHGRPWFQTIGFAEAGRQQIFSVEQVLRLCHENSREDQYQQRDQNECADDLRDPIGGQLMGIMHFHGIPSTHQVT